MRHLFWTSRALTDAEVASMYRTASRHQVDILLWQDTPLPTLAASHWSASGSVVRVVLFLWQLRKSRLVGDA